MFCNRSKPSNFMSKSKIFAQFHIFVPNYSEGGYFLKMRQIKA